MIMVPKERGRLQCQMGPIDSEPNGAILIEGFPNPWSRAEIRSKRPLSLTHRAQYCVPAKRK